MCSLRVHCVFTVCSQCVHCVFTVCSLYRDTGLGCLSDVAVEPALKPWELKDASERLQLDFAILQQQPESSE